MGGSKARSRRPRLARIRGRSAPDAEGTAEGMGASLRSSLQYSVASYPGKIGRVTILPPVPVATTLLVGIRPQVEPLRLQRMDA